MHATAMGRFRVLGCTAGLVLVAALGAGCGGQGPGSGETTGAAPTSGGSPASGDSTASPAPTQSDTGGPVPDEQPRDDLANEQVVEWTDYEVVSDRQVRLFFATGTPDCYGARAVVDEDGEAVRVATVVGTVPGAPENCSLVGRQASILVTTDAPLEGREVVPLEASKALPEGS
jgi:hypothetical protein